MNETNDDQRRHHSITRRLTGAVLLPGAVLIVVWLLAAGTTIYNGFHVRAVGDESRDVTSSDVDFLAGIQRERALSLRFLARPEWDRTELDRQRDATDRALAKLRSADDPLLARSPAEVSDRMRELDGALAALPALRGRVDSREADSGEVHDDYNGFVDAGTRLFESRARTASDTASGQSGLRAAQFLAASEQLSRAASLISDGLRTGEFTPDTHSEYAQLVGAYHSHAASAAESAPPHVRESYRALTASPAWNHVLEWEHLLIGEGEWAVDPRLPFTEQEWLDNTGQIIDDLTALTEAQAAHAAHLAVQGGNSKLATSITGSAIALAVILAAIGIALRAARRVARRLAALHRDTTELAENRLPKLVERLRRGEPVAVATETKQLRVGDDEIGQIADAFNTAQQTAITAATREARAKDGADHVVLCIAHRSQTVTHQQLQLLDELERHEEFPEQRDRLFRLDHLTTRARRNAENLIILSGQHPGRKWSKPVALVNIVHSAIAETEHCERVRTELGAEVALTGSAVADTVHLIAELVDNAIAFSPQHTHVTVLSRNVAKGIAIEVEDHGLGMDEHTREAVNAVFGDPPEFDAMKLRQNTGLGLFVVARLAIKHGISIELRPSAYGGTRAVVLLPSALTANVPVPPAECDTAEIPAARGASDRSSEPRSAFPATAVPESPRSSQLAGTLQAALHASPAAEVVEPEWPPEPDFAEEIRWPASEPSQQDSFPLPRRRRQASLAPQLHLGTAPAGADARPEEVPGRSADEIRDLMSSFQRASNRARAAESTTEGERTDNTTDGEE